MLKRLLYPDNTQGGGIEDGISSENTENPIAPIGEDSNEDPDLPPVPEDLEDEIVLEEGIVEELGKDQDLEDDEDPLD